MLKVGLTGGIASGKSAVARFFSALGVPVIDTDELAREAVAPGTPGLRAVIEAFGRTVLDPHGALDRRTMRKRVFADPAARKRLEAIVHPEVRRLLAERLASLQAPYVLIVVPLLVESGLAREMDRVLVVDCPELLQIDRLAARDGETLAEARNMLAAQATRSQRLACADDVITNDAGLDALEVAVGDLHRRYLTLAQAPPRRGAGK